MSRLSDLLNDLSRAQRMNQPQIVKRSNDLGVPLSKGNVSRYLSGKHPEKPQHATLDAFARVFGVPVEDLEAAATHMGGDPFKADPSADLLTPPQRTAVNEIIRLLLAEAVLGAEVRLFPGMQMPRRDFGWFRDMKEAAGLPDALTFHDLKHSAVSFAVASGADVKVIQNMVGHASAAVSLDVYADLWVSRVDEVATRIDAARQNALA